jgi:MFS transporter, ACS family, hexuronate transporter
MSYISLQPPEEPVAPKTRWIVLGLVFAAAILNYLDRQIIAILKPVLAAELGWSDRDYAHIVSAFQFSAAAAYLAVGWFVDRTGLRWGYSAAVAVWSAAAAAHALARTVLQFTVARAVLGVSEAVHTPAAVKTVAVWFPDDAERSKAIGIMGSAANIGAIATPVLIPMLALALGWQAAFIVTGALGFLWVGAWLMVRVPAEIRARETAEAVSGVGPVPWSALLRLRATWAIAGAKFLIDQVWWFLLFWAPDFFHKAFGLGMREAAGPLAFIYAAAAVGSIVAGGWMPARMMARGMSLEAARKRTFLICALVVLPIPLVLQVDSYWLAAVIIGIALAAHQGFSMNVFAVATDVFPPQVVASVVSIGALLGNIGGLLILEFTGFMLDSGRGYLPMFLFASVAYVLALGWMHLLTPKSVRAPVPA